MAIERGTHSLGPGDGTLLVTTGRAGAAAKAGHDLTIGVTSWSGELEIGENGRLAAISLRADGGSLRVLQGTGGISALGDDDKEGIKETIDKEVLKRTSIAFRSDEVSEGSAGGEYSVRGELELRGRRSPIGFTLALDEDGRVSGEATVTQTDFGMKPYSTLFGTLKVADEVTVTIDAQIRGA